MVDCGPVVTELLTQAVSASKERRGVSLVALKKSLAASGYDVEKNNSRIKLGLRSLVSKGTLVQTKGTGASGSFRLGKQSEAGAKGKKPAAAAKKGKKVETKTAIKATSAARGAKKAAKSPKKVKITKTKKITKSPAKALKPKAKAKPKATNAKVVSRKK
ncbi:histone H1.3-like [Tiliqua scincoides]|uniref:histone H1.3-like n=1 Tax=Tiliqua scincoides TaxID=71010 RepID=UPI003462408A